MGHLTLSLLGPLQVLDGGRPVTGFESQKVRALLVYLALGADRPHTRDALAGLLWPDLPNLAARNNLRQALANLRHALGERAATRPFLLITHDTIQFNIASDYELDVAAFIGLLTTCATHAHRHLEHCGSCAARMEQALALYRGDFLAEFGLGDSTPFEEWQLLMCEQLHQRALDALIRLTDYYERRSDDVTARRCAQRQVELEPWREEAHRQLMRLLARGQQRSAALAQYETCRRILARDLGVEPEAQTTALYELIRDQEPRRQGEDAGQLLGSRAPWRNFPTQTTALIGRVAELADLGALLENPACRLITIVGPGGIGKTRLALAAAAEQADAFAGGAAFVPLQAISAAAFVAPAILAALDIPLQGQRDPRAQLLEYLCDKELLLVLDNLEQLLVRDDNHAEDAATLLADMLAQTSGVTLLVTSRERLALPGEWLFDLVGLSYPSGEMVKGIEDYSAVQLFVQRARQVRRQVALAEGEARAVARICQLVEGLPLAIELAASALRTRSCAAIAAAIEHGLSALAIELRAVPERQRSIWATFEHSWRLLSDDESRVFARLSVFRGGFAEDAAIQVAQASPELLRALVDKSLLRWDGVARYDMHELVRQYAGEKLEQVGEEHTTRRAHARYYLALAEQAEPELWEPQQATWLQRLDIEHDNMRVVLEWSHRDTDRSETGARLAVALGWFWLWRGHRQEGSTHLQAVLVSLTEPTLLRARALHALGMLLLEGDILPAQAPFEECLAISRALGDAKSQADALYGLGWLGHLVRGGRMSAEAYIEECLVLYQQVSNTLGIARVLGISEDPKRCEASLALYRRVGHLRGCADILTNLARMAKKQEDYRRALASLQEALDLYRQLKDEGGELWVIIGLCEIYVATDEYDLAAVLAEDGIALARKLNDRMALAWALTSLGVILSWRNEFPRARSLFDESVSIFLVLGRHDGLWQGIIGHAGIAVAAGKAVQAVRLCASVDTVSIAEDRPRRNWDPEHRGHYKRVLAAARVQLDQQTFAAAWAEGQAMTLEQAIAYALKIGDVDAEQSALAAAKQSS